MYRMLVAALMLVSASAVPALAQFTWTKASPGGGGSFQTVDVAADGKVLVGSDLSGAYLRSGTSNWTRLGRAHGIEATAVVAVRWKPGQSPSLDALIGTKNGLYRTANGGSTWTRVSAYAPRFVSAIAWKGQVIYVAGADASDEFPLRLYRSPDDGGSWTVVNHGITSTGFNNVRRAVKLEIDASDNLWLLSGHDGYRPGKKELYRSTTGGTGMVMMHGLSIYPIDVAPHPTIANRVLMSASNSSTSGGADGEGTVYSSTTAAPTMPVWIAATIQNGSTTTGAIWWEGNDDAYLVDVYDNACASSGANERARRKVPWHQHRLGAGQQLGEDRRRPRHPA